MPEPDATIAERDDATRSHLMETALFHDLTRWREQLARSIARNNLVLRSGGIATATNRILISLLFLRIAEDRGLVAEGTLQEIADHPDPYGQMLEVTASLALLFEDETGAASHDAVPMGMLSIEDRAVRAILTRLVAPDRPYRFAAMETETIAEVLARYLARTIRRSAAHQADVVDTHDTVLSGGTPAPPLPVIRYLAGSTLRAADEARSKRELLPVRVIDPSCGTGTVLLSAYRYLLASRGGDRLTFEERHAILTGSLHGVDSDRHAVAATTMLLLFMLCEGRRPVPHGSFPAFSEGIFGELRHTIRHGDALIGPAIEDDESWAFCPARERHTIHAFAWDQEFPEVFSSGGFDAVISSPPGGSIGQREWIQRYLQRHYTVFNPSADRSAFFIEKGLALIRPGGILGMCTGDRWFRGRTGTPLRALLSARQVEEIVDFPAKDGKDGSAGTCIIRITNRPLSHRPRVTIVDPGYSGDIDHYVQAHAFPLDRQALGKGGWTLRDSRAEAILEKVRKTGTSLEDYVMGQVSPARETVPDPVFMIDTRTRKTLINRDPRCKTLIRPVIDGAAIGRYEPAAFASYVICIPRGWTASHPAAGSRPWRWFRTRHPVLARFLKERAGRGTEADHDGDFWWETMCEDGTLREKTPRVLFRERFDVPAFAYDNGRAIAGPGTVALSTSGPYLAGLLNSRLIAFVFAKTATVSGRPRAGYSWEDLRDIRVYIPDFDDPADAGRHDRIISLVTRLLDLKKRWSRAGIDQDRGLLQKKIETTDRKIDRIVYEMYGLSDEEVAVVEANIA